MLRLAVIVIALAACGKSSGSSDQPAASQAPAKPAPKDPRAARKLIAEGAVVIDVRTAGEYAEGHLPQATLIPIDELAQRIVEVEQLTKGDKTKPIVVYCASGVRSRKAKQQLDSAGYQQVVNGGGYDDLQ